jgi:restriction endonuclease S subunit
MIDGLKPYPAMKDSGVTWLGAMPEHWEVRKLGALFRRHGSGTTPSSDQYYGGNIPWVMTGDLNDGLVDTTKRTVTNAAVQDLSALRVYKRGALIIAMYGATIGKSGVLMMDACTNQACCVLAEPLESVSIGFLHKVVKMAKPHLIEQSYGGGQPNINAEIVRALRAPIPPLPEQAAIVHFLDHANQKIDRYIRAKRKLIALLNEQKQAIIHRAVTRGLDPDVPLKPSGIPWLGEIPEHWEVLKLKQGISKIEQGWSPQCYSQSANENEWGVLKVGCVNKESFLPEQNKKLPNNLQPELSLEIVDGDILVSRANTPELLGLAALAESPRPKLILCDKLFRFRSKPTIFNPKFLVLALRSKPSRIQIQSNTNGASSSMQNIGQGVLKNLLILAPPLAEQVSIVNYATRKCSSLNTIISRTEREIALMQEYRTRLTADIVTGKLDVREAAAKLPDLSSEGEVTEEDFDVNLEDEPNED